ncbi:MAG: hypothetical protein AB8B97_15735 [Granulosicoccus sp.]
MKPYILFSAQPIRALPLMLVGALIVSGCSESSEPVASEPVAGEPTTSEPASNEPASNDALSTDETSGDTEGDPVSPNPVVADPQIQNEILVSFEITVPFYLSDELSMELVWGDIKLDAMWVGGQSWSASGDFPTETERLLEITFYDNNGAIELARYSQSYKTASNVSEALQIPAEQFDANQFDADGDGVNNLEELIAETNPLVDEQSPLDIEDFYSISSYDGEFSRMSVSESFESLVPDARPYVGTFDAHPDWPESLSQDFPISGDINLDADGNGTLSMQAGESRPQLQLTGTRTHSENSISWAGDRQEWSSDYNHKEYFENTVSAADENTWNLVEEVTGSNDGTYLYEWETKTDLTGELVEGSSLCKPVAGTFTATNWTTSVRGQYESIEEISISKDMEDRYWRVEIVDDNILDDTLKIRAYFVRELRIRQRADVPDSAHFICDFADI